MIIYINNIYIYIDATLQVHILNNLYLLFYKSIRNLYLCKNLNILGLLIELLPNITSEKAFS